jgi:hypothetical protein
VIEIQGLQVGLSDYLKLCIEKLDGGIVEHRMTAELFHFLDCRHVKIHGDPVIVAEDRWIIQFRGNSDHDLVKVMSCILGHFPINAPGSGSEPLIYLIVVPRQ